MARYNKSSDIKVAVVGYGGAFNMGRSHLKQMHDAGMTPTAVTELDPERLKVAKDDHLGIETYNSVQEMLDKSKVDLVTIITPHNTHAELAIQCMDAGRHVVTEKPFAITTEECDQMIAAAERNDVVLSTFHNRHWDGIALEAVDQILNKKVIGEVVRIQAQMGGWNKPGDWWRSSKSISGGVLYDWGAHLLEYSLQLIASEIVEVTGHAHTGHWAPRTVWKEDTIEDEGFAVVRFKNNAWLTLRISNIDANPNPRILEVTGTEGSYLADHASHEIIKPQGKGTTLVTRERNRAGEGHKFYQNIAAHLTGGEKLVITPEWARRPIHILDLADRSVKEGRAMLARYG